MKQHLAVSAIGSDRTGMVHELTRVISECGGNIT
ncbi:MAG: ACT domain-containing protein, partial [Steroidobacteraceae bacterium]